MLQLSSDHQQTDTEWLQYSIINSKGFGGNNATATLLSPTVARKMMQMRYSSSEWAAWQHANEAVRERQQQYDDDMIAGKQLPIYKFDHGVLGDDDVEMNAHELRIADQKVGLDLESPYDDMRID